MGCCCSTTAFSFLVVSCLVDGRVSPSCYSKADKSSNPIVSEAALELSPKKLLYDIGAVVVVELAGV